MVKTRSLGWVQTTDFCINLQITESSADYRLTYQKVTILTILMLLIYIGITTFHPLDAQRYCNQSLPRDLNRTTGIPSSI